MFRIGFSPAEGTGVRVGLFLFLSHPASLLRLPQIFQETLPSYIDPLVLLSVNYVVGIHSQSSC